MSLTREIWEIIIWAVRAILAISVLLGIWRYRRLGPTLRPVFFYLLLNLITELLSRYWKVQFGNNLVLLHVYTPLEFIVWSWFYRQWLLWLPGVQRWFWPFVGGVVFLIVANSIWLQPVDTFNSYAKGLVQTLIIVYAVLYFFSGFSQLGQQSKTHYLSLGLINAAVLMYYAGSLFIFMFGNLFIGQGLRLPIGFWLFNALLNLMFQGIILVALARVLLQPPRLSTP